jgi:hypothetical protein
MMEADEDYNTILQQSQKMDKLIVKYYEEFDERG